ncbi:MAG: hypothetical protein SCK28_01060 [Bacillota bacterium]|nr:hypothetical protein [Bacillota bacterium]
MMNKKAFGVLFLLLMTYLAVSLSMNNTNMSTTIGDVPQEGYLKQEESSSSNNSNRNTATAADKEQDDKAVRDKIISQEVITELARDIEEVSAVENANVNTESKAADITAEEVTVMVLANARDSIRELYEESVVLQDVKGNLALRHPQLANRNQVSEYFSKHFGQPILGLMNLFMIRNTPDNSYTLVRYKGMVDILTAEIAATKITSASNTKLVIVAELAEEGDYWGEIKVRYTLSKDSNGKWRITGLNML